MWHLSLDDLSMNAQLLQPCTALLLTCCIIADYKSVSDGCKWPLRRASAAKDQDLLFRTGQEQCLTMFPSCGCPEWQRCVWRSAVGGAVVPRWRLCPVPSLHPRQA